MSAPFVPQLWYWTRRNVPPVPAATYVRSFTPASPWRRVRLSERPADDAVSIDYDPESETYLAVFDSDVIAPSMAIVEVMASVHDTAPTELEPLVETVDPSAIDRLVNGDEVTDDRVLKFRYLDHVVTVRGEGVVEVRSPSPDADD